METNNIIDETVKDRIHANVEHPSHYMWLKELCGIEPIDICQHLSFNCGCAVKYILRKNKEEKNLTVEQQRLQDIRKAIFYLNKEAELLVCNIQQNQTTCQDI